MLSRVADNVFWLARYMERVENLARLVEVNASLMLESATGNGAGWQPLITITGAGAQSSREQGYSAGAAGVVRFVVADGENPGSMLSSLAHAREIGRARIRDILPRGGLGSTSIGLYLYVNEHAADTVSRAPRHAFLKHVILATQTLTGMLEGIVSEGPALWFMALGRNMERADMTSRIVDVRALAMLPVHGSPLRPFATVQSISVLRSLSGYHMYRLRARQRVYPARRVVGYLLADADFPRAVSAVCSALEARLRRLPNSRVLLRRLRNACGGVVVRHAFRKALA
jgi:uncharacterized alpha-E superfamily protein